MGEITGPYGTPFVSKNSGDHHVVPCISVSTVVLTIIIGIDLVLAPKMYGTWMGKIVNLLVVLLLLLLLLLQEAYLKNEMI